MLGSRIYSKAFMGTCTKISSYLQLPFFQAMKVNITATQVLVDTVPGPLTKNNIHGTANSIRSLRPLFLIRSFS